MNKFLFRTFYSAVLLATLIGSAPSAQAEWSVSIESPTNVQVYTAPADIQLEDFVDGTSPPITALIQFYANSNLVGTFMNGPGTNRSSVMWTNVPAGTYDLIAVATAETGVETSAPVTITVSGAPSNPDTNPPPSGFAFGLSIESPTNVEIFQAPATIQLEDMVSGTTPTSVETVQFFANSNLIATVTNGAGTNLSFTTWTSVVSGNYMLTAMATDNSGNVVMSEPVSISVGEGTPGSSGANPPPTVSSFSLVIESPGDGEVFTLPADVALGALVNDVDESLIETVQFFANSNLVATATNGVGTNVSFVSWPNFGPGSYTITAIATDEIGNMATSAPVSITVSAGSSSTPPLDSSYGVVIESPTNGEVFGASGTIQLEDSVYGTSPTSVETVQFFANSNLVATITNGAGTNSSSIAWSNVASGIYTLTAVATDNSANVLTSPPVQISVGEGPINNSSAPHPLSINQPTVVGIYPTGSAAVMGINHAAGGCVYLSIPVTGGAAYSLQRSTDLVNWSPVSTNTALNAAAQFIDPKGNASCQFYRIVPGK